jgi:hypothetical protein
VLFVLTETSQLLLVFFYTSLPPSRGLEIRTLQLGTSLVHRTTTSSWWLVLQNYKTSTTKGQDSLEIDPASQKLLVDHLVLFRDHYRTILFEKWASKHPENDQDQNYLFVPSSKSENPFYSDSTWSQYVTTIFREKSGMGITINMLRSAFVTHFYNTEDSDNLGLRESIASGMRHSVARAKSTYDKRTAFEKKRRAVDYCGQSVSKFLKGDSAGSQPEVSMKKGPGNKVYNDNVPFIVSPEVGDVVAVPFWNENKQKEFWLGKVLRKTGETNTVLLAWLEQQPADDNSNSHDSYKLKIGVAWEEHILSLLFPIDIIQDANNSSCYKLVTLAEDILHTVCD